MHVCTYVVRCNVYISLVTNCHSHSGPHWLTQKPTLNVITAKVVPFIASNKWRYVGLELGMESFKLEAFSSPYQEDFRSYCYDMFKTWLQGAPGTGELERTWEVVITAVEKVKGTGTGYQDDVKKSLKGMYRRTHTRILNTHTHTHKTHTTHTRARTHACTHTHTHTLTHTHLHTHTQNTLTHTQNTHICMTYGSTQYTYIVQNVTITFVCVCMQVISH